MKAPTAVFLIMLFVVLCVFGWMLKEGVDLITTICYATIVSYALCGAKAVIGFHFSWEVCQCCGKRYAEHWTKQ